MEGNVEHYLEENYSQWLSIRFHAEYFGCLLIGSIIFNIPSLSVELYNVAWLAGIAIIYAITCRIILFTKRFAYCFAGIAFYLYAFINMMINVTFESNAQEGFVVLLAIGSALIFPLIVSRIYWKAEEIDQNLRSNIKTRLDENRKDITIMKAVGYVLVVMLSIAPVLLIE